MKIYRKPCLEVADAASLLCKTLGIADRGGGRVVVPVVSRGRNVVGADLGAVEVEVVVDKLTRAVVD